MLQSNNGRWNIQFRDLLEVAEYIRTEPAKWEQRSSTGNAATMSWDLNAGYEGTVRAMLQGWPEGLENIGVDIASMPNAVTYEREYNFAGELPDVPRYLSGDPRCMTHRGKQHKPTRVMTIAVNIVCSGATEARAMQRYGAAMAAIVDRLEARHVRVELLACWAGNFRDGKCCASWTVKRAEDHLDLNAVAFSLGHPGALRRIAFAVMERSPRSYEDYGYGMPRDQPERADFLDIAEDALLIGGIGVNGGNSKCRTMEEALAFVEAEVNAAAGEPIASLEVL